MHMTWRQRIIDIDMTSKTGLQSAQNHEKFTKNPICGDLRSFKVIDVGTTGKLVSSACYDDQQVCVYM